MKVCIDRNTGALAVLLLLAGCGDGGGGGKMGTGAIIKPEVSNTTTMTCPDAGTQCTGSTILRTDSGIAVTASSVQVYATSTNDLQVPNNTPGIAVGLQPATGGLADIRVKHDASGAVTHVALLLSQLGLSWDGKTERPPIIETFLTHQGRVQLDADGKISTVALPPSSDLHFFDFARKGKAGTQAHYANNVYFPRTEPIRCPSDAPNCPQQETEGVQSFTGDWHSGGTVPDNALGTRLHEDGATDAGDNADANGNPVPPPNGRGVPFPGFKGFRNFHDWSYQYANLASWITQDTVAISEWGGTFEHNKARRGFVAFGQVTPPASVPTTGTARYIGHLKGWWSFDPSLDSYPIAGDAEAVVDFAARTVKLTVTTTRIDEGTQDPVPVNLSTTVSINSAQFANYFNGAASNDSLSGALSGRFFGPVAAGGSGNAPAELAGAFRLLAANNGPVAIGGFLLRKI